MRGVKIGQRDRQIQFQRAVKTSNGYNEEEISSWETVATVWAKVTEAHGSETYQSDQLTESRLTVFDIWYLSCVNVEMRIAYNGRYYEIRSIIEPDRRRSLKIKAELLDER